ncbi:TetR/AcrR family transcriptional regulator [Rhodopila sp.]|uniref:TetR/AcrR family transcriptional regulator n=1 Tax=Rhodopila sp. TaxID=2480087 RepID=UPI003D0E0C09
MRPASTVAARDTYRHGDLRRALLEAGIALARSGGPQAVTLREATRRAGVVPNAAYRHFNGQQDLLQAVRSAALSSIAVAMEQELSAIAAELSPAAFAKASLRAVGRGYLRFAFTEPGLFRTAFGTGPQQGQGRSTEQAGGSGLDPFQLLSLALDRMTAASVLPAERRDGAEYLAWSAVHGLAMLVIDGPLRGMDGGRIEAAIARLLGMVEDGI